MHQARLPLLLVSGEIPISAEARPCSVMAPMRVLPHRWVLSRFFRVGLVLGIMTSVAWAQDYRSLLIRSPYSLSFGATVVGEAADRQTITLLNTGAAGVQIDKIVVTGDFAETTDCPQSPAYLAQNQPCGIDVTFRPASPGFAPGTVSVFHDRSPHPLTVSLTGLGTLNGSIVKISLSSLNFGDQKTHTASVPQTITVSNTGGKGVLVSAIRIEGDFKIVSASTCKEGQDSLAPGSSCTVVVTFNPLGVGTREGRINFIDDAAGSPRTIMLIGFGRQQIN